MIMLSALLAPKVRHAGSRPVVQSSCKGQYKPKVPVSLSGLQETKFIVEYKNYIFIHHTSLPTASRVVYLKVALWESLSPILYCKVSCSNSLPKMQRTLFSTKSSACPCCRDTIDILTVRGNSCLGNM